MAKAGKIDDITTKDASFEGSGVEGQKGAEESAPPAEEETPPAAEESAPSAEEETPPAEETEEPAESFEGASYVVTHRNGKAQKVFFRDGKEIGSEDV